MKRECTEAPARSHFVFACLVLLLALSGCAALIYEIVWFQLLQLVIGSSAISLGLLLAAYMGGMCLGSGAFPRLVPAGSHPLKRYALLELGIGAFGIIGLFAAPLAGRLYLASAATGLAGLVLRGAVAAVCLLPPAVLMGASLPAVSRWAKATPQGVSRIGLLYSANIAGGIMGCILAGFYLLRVHDMATATFSAAGMNAAVALAAIALSRGAGASAPPLSLRAASAPGAFLIYLAIALSGLTALAAEVVWTRLLSLLLGATVYTFSIILAVFLMGLWGGSAAGSFVARRVSRPREALAVCQVLLGVAIAWTAFTIADVLPYWPVDPWLSTSAWFNFDLDFTRCLRAIFPATLLWGASFPLALAGVARVGEDPAGFTGKLYAANTAGSIAGALGFSLILIPALGTQSSQQWLIALAAAGAAAALLAVRSLRAYAAIAAAALLAWGLTATVPAMPWQAIAYGRRVAPILRGLSTANDAQTQPLFVGEGVNSSVVITQRGDQRFFYVSGKSEASSAPLDMRLQRMMGHIPALFHRAPRSVLVVGFGAGVTAGSLVPYPEVRSIVVCELEKLIPPASDEFFGNENAHVLRDPRARIVYDDARHFIATSPEKFDIITTDPIHPWVKGTSALYSREYYELVKSHLNPGGVAAQWLPIYESTEETVKTELATFFEVFPAATVWSNYKNGDGYDLVLIGRAQPSAIDIDALQKRLEQPAYSAVATSLAGAEFHSALELLATYAGRASDLRPLLFGVPLNEDASLHLQYLAGMGLNSLASAEIYRDLLSYRKFPADLLTGSASRVEALEAVIGRRHRTF